MGSPNKFSSEFKSDAAAYYPERKGEVTKAQAAANLGISLSALDRCPSPHRTMHKITEHLVNMV